MPPVFNNVSHVNWKEKPLPVLNSPAHSETEQGPVGLPGTEVFFVPRFL